MANDIYLSLLSSEFSGEEAEKVEFAAIMGYALDSVKKKEQLEDVFYCYVPFYALELSGNNFMIFNSVSKKTTILSVYSPPTLKEVQALMKQDFSSLQERYKALKTLLTRSEPTTLEITGALTGEDADGLAKMITQHLSSANNRYKKLSSQLTKAEAQRELQKISKHVLSPVEFGQHITKLLDEIEAMFEKEIERLIKEEKNVKAKYEALIEKTKQEVQARIKEIKSEEAKKQKEIEAEMEKEKKNIIFSLKSENQWKTLNNDFNILINAKKQLDAKISSASSEKDIDNLIKALRNLQDDLQTLGANINSTTNFMENRLRDIEDLRQQAEVDKRNISDKLSLLQDQEKKKIGEIQDEKEVKLKEIRVQQKEYKDLLNQLKKERKEIENQMETQYKASPTTTISGDLLGVSETQIQATIHVPVAICKYKERSKHNFVVLPPVEIPAKMKKPKSSPLTGLNISDKY